MIGQLSWLRFDFPSHFRLDGRWAGFSSSLATSELVSDPQESPIIVARPTAEYEHGQMKRTIKGFV